MWKLKCVYSNKQQPISPPSVSKVGFKIKTSEGSKVYYFLLFFLHSFLYSSLVRKTKLWSAWKRGSMSASKWTLVGLLQGFNALRPVYIMLHFLLECRQSGFCINCATRYHVNLLNRVPEHDCQTFLVLQRTKCKPMHSELESFSDASVLHRTKYKPMHLEWEWSPCYFTVSGNICIYEYIWIYMNIYIIIIYII